METIIPIVDAKIVRNCVSKKLHWEVAETAQKIIQK